MLKKQIDVRSNNKLSKMYLKNGTKPFDDMPFCSSLIKHNPSVIVLMNCIDDHGREHEFFAKYILNKIDNDGTIFVKIDEKFPFTDVDHLIKMFNSRLHFTHETRKIVRFKDYLYIKGYAEDCYEIIRKIVDLSKDGIEQYSDSVKSWLSDEPYIIDCDEKKEKLINLFDSTKVAMIYGAAGTGKTTMIKHISNFFSKQKKIYLANTHPAVTNLQRKVKVTNSEFHTISSFLENTRVNSQCDILFIDECSTISNLDMRKVLEKANYELLVLVGDTYQIESISFGNWFELIKNFVGTNAIIELKEPYRAKQVKNLLTVWQRVRDMSDDIQEALIKFDYVKKLDSTIFENKLAEDEIILCFNYDGLYGINNMNRFLQDNNENAAYYVGANIFKVGDPILFNESNRFAPLIYNNTKGKIINIIIEENVVWFDIELDYAINELDISPYSGLFLVGKSEKGNSIIRFSVLNSYNTDEDNESVLCIVPFQVSYVVSIHKAQGLEFNSVKIILTNQIEEKITHNIFYTAITRSKEKLCIYWSPETENNILERIKIQSKNTDMFLLSTIYKIPFIKKK